MNGALDAIHNLLQSSSCKSTSVSVSVCHKLRKGDRNSLFKNGDDFARKNYRPVTVLPVMSKI